MKAGTATPWTLALLSALALAVGAGSPARPEGKPFDVVRQATIKPGDPLPAPQGPVVLTVLGAPRGGGKPLAFDMPTLERLGTVRYRSKNRWYDEPVTYEGVLGTSLLSVVGVPPGAVRLKLRALNEYVVRIPIDEMLKWPVLFALKLDGAYMPVREKGPIWVVYPNHLYPELGEGLYQDRWIWQLKEMSFEP